MKISHPSAVVRCTWPATDKNDNKITDKPSKKETMDLISQISKEYETPVIIELSKDAAKALKENLFQKENAKFNESYKKELKEKSALLQAFLEPAQKLHQIIPNIQTNQKLEASLQGADEKITNAAYSIIQNLFLPYQVENLSGKERQELIYVGLEEAAFLAERLNKNQADSFMEAMHTIAQYGINGRTDQQGRVTYDIRWGAPAGAPDDYICAGDFMQRIDPEQYKTYSSMLDAAIRKNDSHLLLSAARFAIDWEKQSYQKNPEPFEQEKAKQQNWKKQMDHTKINSSYNHTDKSDIHTFMNSIISQNKILKEDFLSEILGNFAKML